jgi:hypothetical protein
MRAFEFLWQVNEHPDGRHGILDGMSLVPHLNREAQTAYADLVYAQLAMVALALFIVELVVVRFLWNPPGSPCFRCFQHRATLTAEAGFAKNFSLRSARWKDK